MSVKFKTAIVLSFAALLTNGALAADGETPLGNCYNDAIQGCSYGPDDHYDDCINTLLDACDDNFGGGDAANGIGNLSGGGASRSGYSIFVR